MNSNLIAHIKSFLHYVDIYQEYLALERSTCSSPKEIKRKRIDSNSIETPTKTLYDIGVVAVLTKFKADEIMLQERLLKIFTMIIKCMLPISIVENKEFKEYISYIDPSFHMPSVQTVRDSGLNVLYCYANYVDFLSRSREYKEKVRTNASSSLIVWNLKVNEDKTSSETIKRDKEHE